MGSGGLYPNLFPLRPHAVPARREGAVVYFSASNQAASSSARGVSALIHNALMTASRYFLETGNFLPETVTKSGDVSVASAILTR